jgi:protein-disulfide isomerase
MPFVVDPQGKLADAVKADYELGTRLGVHQTPTVRIVTDKHGVTNATQVSDFSKLYSMLDEAVAETSGAKQARK